jgi:hypothetical protein
MDSHFLADSQLLARRCMSRIEACRTRLDRNHQILVTSDVRLMESDVRLSEPEGILILRYTPEE